MGQSHLVGVGLALLSALFYGSADFSGGVASRRSHHFQVLALASLISVVFLGTLTVIGQESLPSLTSIRWAALAGISGSLGMTAFYRGLSLGSMAIVAPIAGVIGAVIPVIFSIVMEGFPGVPQLLGFGIACLGIWLVTKTSSVSKDVSQKGIMLAILSGVGFGGFFILISQVESSSILASVTIQKTVSGGIMLLLLTLKRLPFPSIHSHQVAVLAGFLDASASALYLFAKQFTRLDVAVVLSSLYPAATVLLAYVLLKENISRTQWIGVALCVTAIGLIVL